jgi:hypothetical protein
VDRREQIRRKAASEQQEDDDTQRGFHPIRYAGSYGGLGGDARVYE